MYRLGFTRFRTCLIITEWFVNEQFFVRVSFVGGGFCVAFSRILSPQSSTWPTYFMMIIRCRSDGWWWPTANPCCLGFTAPVARWKHRPHSCPHVPTGGGPSNGSDRQLLAFRRPILLPPRSCQLTPWNGHGTPIDTYVLAVPGGSSSGPSLAQSSDWYSDRYLTKR